MRGDNRWVFAALALGFWLAGCATREPVRLDGAQTTGEPGVLWTYATYKQKLFERWNHAIVVEVDGVMTFGPVSNPPVELAPGRHEVKIRYERDSYLCGYFGCISFEQTTRRLELLVEPDHSYVPRAGKYCGRDWIWIVDIGGGASQQLKQWLERGTLPYRLFELPSAQNAAAGQKVVGGEAPPSNCETEQE